MLRLLFAVFALCLWPLSNAASAQVAVTQSGQDQTDLEQRAEQVVALINGEIEPSELLTAGFLEVVPEAQFKAIGQQLTSQFGRALSVEELSPPDGTRARLLIRMERAIAKGGIAIDPKDDNRISELVFRTFDPIGDSVDKIKADLEKLPGDISAYFGPLDGGPATIALNTDAQLPLGSTMKLFVLGALGQEIAQGKRAWSDVVTLKQRSFPSGQMQDWPLGVPITLHTLASMMISISDNTATDALITELGRERMAEFLRQAQHSEPIANDPWMTTRELFLLKGGDPDRLSTYIRANSKVRAQILQGIESEKVDTDDIAKAFSGGPLAINVEWFASSVDLARLFRLMRRQSDKQVFAIMAINKSASAEIAAKWDYIGFKGGSEPGVLNLTWLLRGKDGRDRMLWLSWANTEAALDEDTLELIAQRILSLPQ